MTVELPSLGVKQGGGPEKPEVAIFLSDWQGHLVYQRRGHKAKAQLGSFIYDRTQDYYLKSDTRTIP